MRISISIEDPRAEDVSTLLATHLAFSRSATPAEYSFALDVDELLESSVTFFAAREEGQLVGVAALKELDCSHAELKSMHIVESQRNRGVGQALVRHVLAHARKAGYRQVSLETGSTDEFAPARCLYVKAGFEPCGPFGGYRASPYNTFMTASLEIRPGTPPNDRRDRNHSAP